MTFNKKTDDVEIISNETVFDKYFQMTEYHLRHQTFAGGWSEVMSREVFQRGAVVAVLPYDAKRDRLVLIEQFRVGAYAACQSGPLYNQDSSPWLIECVAGVIEEGEPPEEVARRELKEEANCDTLDIFHVNTWHASPGAINEPLALYCANVDSSTAEGIHGLDHEYEDIRVFSVNPETALDWLNDGSIHNATTIIALQWFALNHDKLRKRWG
jgi:ADP-ribose pyrophosphatase